MRVQGPNAGFSKLMNRLLGVHVDMQRKIFDYFTALQVLIQCSPSCKFCMCCTSEGQSGYKPQQGLSTTVSRVPLLMTGMSSNAILGGS